jgi:hypothetical protein
LINYLRKSQYVVHIPKERYKALLNSGLQTVINDINSRKSYLNPYYADDIHLVVSLDLVDFNDPWFIADEGCLINQYIECLLGKPKKAGRPPNEIDDWAAEQLYLYRKPRREVFLCWKKKVVDSGYLYVDYEDAFKKTMKRRRTKFGYF